jgi:hypothetical protein
MQRFLLCILFLVPIICFSQVNEGRLWTGVSISKELSDKFSLSIEEQFRFGNDFKAFSQAFTELEANYSLSKAFELGGSYRLAFQTEDLLNRFSANINYTYKAKPWYLSFRLTVQEDLYRTSVNESHLRYKIQMRHRFNKRWSIYAGTESWTSVFPQVEGLTRIRYSVGSRFSRKSNKIRVFYNYQQNYGSEISSTAHILAIKYGFELQ